MSPARVRTGRLKAQAVGRPGVQRLADALTVISTECTRRDAAHADPELAAIAVATQAAAERLVAADRRKLAAQVEARQAGLDLEERYLDGLEARQRATARIFSIYGFQRTELGAFGVRPPAGLKAPRPTESTSTSTPTTDEESTHV